MARIIRSYSALVDEINKAVTVAVRNVAKVVCDKLHDCINEQYYLDSGFYPNIYDRTETFLNHAAYKMISDKSALIGVDTSSMHYKNGFSAKQVVEWASQSMHGSPLYQTNTKDFWSVFIEWADENVPQLLKDELKRQGLNVK